MAEDNLENWNTYRQGNKALRINKRLLYIYLYQYVIEFYLTREWVVFKGQSYVDHNGESILPYRVP